jgi:hypothetical protein
VRCRENPDAEQKKPFVQQQNNLKDGKALGKEFNVIVNNYRP